EGQKPSIFYNPENMDDPREAIFHENIHGHIGYLGLEDQLASTNKSPIVQDIFHGGFPAEAQDLYRHSPALGEEVFAYAASAVRTGNQSLLDAFGDADGGKEHVLQWTSDPAKELLDQLPMEDSLHKRVFERRMNSVISRASSQIEDM